MATINNADVIENGIKDLKIERARDKAPTETSDKVVLTYPLKITRRIKLLNSTTTRSTSATGIVLGTTHATRRTFITGCLLANMSDAVADNTQLNVYTTDIFGATIRLNQVTKLTTTAIQFNQYNEFAFDGIEVGKGANISFDNVFTVGASTSSILVFGYEID